MKANTKRGHEPPPFINTPPTELLRITMDTWPAAFRSKIDATGDACWHWDACKAKGYGRFAIGRTFTPKIMHAHRVAFILTYPHININDTHIDHLCRNPSCVRPDHLEPVQPGENLRRGRQMNVAGICRAGLHPWIPSNILHEPPTPTQPDGVRRCRPCRNAWDRARKRVTK